MLSLSSRFQTRAGLRKDRFRARESPFTFSPTLLGVGDLPFPTLLYLSVPTERVPVQVSDRGFAAGVEGVLEDAQGGRALGKQLLRDPLSFSARSSTGGTT